MEKTFLATRNFLRDEEGVTIIEYALMAALWVNHTMPAPMDTRYAAMRYHGRTYLQQSQRRHAE